LSDWASLSQPALSAVIDPAGKMLVDVHQVSSQWLECASYC
jgi:hypothetical protein